MKKSKKNKKQNVAVTINVDLESAKLQRQLHAISKHTEAMANELHLIDLEEDLKKVSQKKK